MKKTSLSVKKQQSSTKRDSSKSKPSSAKKKIQIKQRDTQVSRKSQSRSPANSISGSKNQQKDTKSKQFADEEINRMIEEEEKRMQVASSSSSKRHQALAEATSERGDNLPNELKPPGQNDQILKKQIEQDPPQEQQSDGASHNLEENKSQKLKEPSQAYCQDECQPAHKADPVSAQKESEQQIFEKENKEEINSRLEFQKSEKDQNSERREDKSREGKDEKPPSVGSDVAKEGSEQDEEAKAIETGSKYDKTQLDQQKEIEENDRSQVDTVKYRTLHTHNPNPLQNKLKEGEEQQFQKNISEKDFNLEESLYQNQETLDKREYVNRIEQDIEEKEPSHFQEGDILEKDEDLEIEDQQEVQNEDYYEEHVEVYEDNQVEEHGYQDGQEDQQQDAEVGYHQDDNQDDNQDDHQEEDHIEEKITAGHNLKDVDDLKSQAKTVSIQNPHYDNIFGSQYKADDQDAKTDLNRIYDPPEFKELESEIIGFMDEEDQIQPRDTQFDDLPLDYISLIQITWAKLKEQGAEKLGVSLMRNLFRVSPQILQLFSFRDDENLFQSAALKQTSSKLLSALNQVVLSLNDLKKAELVQNGLDLLGKKHSQYGVQPDHYNIMCKAIMITFGIILGDDFTQDVRQAWFGVLKMIIQKMVGKPETPPEPRVIHGQEEVKNEYEIQKTDPEYEQCLTFDLVDEKHRDHLPSLEIDQAETEVDGFTSKDGHSKQKNDASSLHIPSKSEIEMKDLGILEDNFLTKTQISHIRKSWVMVQRNKGIGVMILDNLFNLNPKLMSLFNFTKKQNWQLSNEFELHTHSLEGAINKIVNNLESPDVLENKLRDLGSKHNDLGVQSAHFAMFGKALIRALEDSLGRDFTYEMRQTWEKLYQYIQSQMSIDILEKEAKDRIQTLQYVSNQNPDPSFRSVSRVEETLRKLMDSESGIFGDEIEPSRTLKSRMGSCISATTKPEEVKEYYLNVFRNEVDFHHKIAYRFEKAYRLGKQAPDQKYTMNMEVLECIAEHSAYIENDPMCLFYCLYFCIIYKNDQLLDFFRNLIDKMPRIPKLDKLQELIDVYGLARLRTKGEPINTLVYHMVFYQAIDDNLRIVYSWIFQRMSFFQLRDKDALHLLQTRDYEMIWRAFNVYTTKISFSDTFQAPQQPLGHSYRKYNQAYFEEISVNYDVEKRVAQNYRERFLVTSEDIYIVFEMYCKEDYEKQFRRTTKDQIDDQQFKRLFQICLRNDSFKIATLIYCLYLKKQEFDAKMMDLIMLSMKNSPKFHEVKLFFFLSHFDVLSIYQMDQVLDLYIEILHSKDPSRNPMISQFNPTKVALMIYKICWTIEKKEIYSLITKCDTLEGYIIRSLQTFFVNQESILILYKNMSEPILDLETNRDSLDIMATMNMHQLLQHPIVVEVLNLVYEGRYSFSSSAISMSPTFKTLLEQPTIQDKSISNILVQNVKDFGSDSLSIQSGLMFNIWKVSIEQRQEDQIFFTAIFTGLILFFFYRILEFENQSSQFTKDYFQGDLSYHFALLSQLENGQLQNFCMVEGRRLIEENDQIANLIFLLEINFLGMIAWIFVKAATIHYKDNVSFDWVEGSFRILFAAASLLFVFQDQTREPNKLFENTCDQVIEISSEDRSAMTSTFTFRYTLDGDLPGSLLLSVNCILAVLLCIFVLKQSKKVGDILMMLEEMMGEMVKFFLTFGAFIAAIYFSGRLLIHQLKVEKMSILIDLFNALNSSADFNDFTQPQGQVYIMSITFVFRVLLISVLGAMFINKFRQSFNNLESTKRLKIIELKNSIAYDSKFGGITMSFFPFNIIAMFFIIPVILTKNKAISGLALKIQYSVMMAFYIFFAFLVSIAMAPMLYMKSVVNSTYIAFTSSREAYPHQRKVDLAISVLGGLPIICLSLVVDLFQMPLLLFSSSRHFEHKYQMNQNQLNMKQTQTVQKLFHRLFYGSKKYQYQNTTLSMGDLMDKHKSIFKLVINLHDLFCRGQKDYLQALKNVQDYNMSKLLTSKCAIPDKNGDFVRGLCNMNIIRNVQEDIHIYNYIDLTLRKAWMGLLESEIKKSESELNAENEDMEVQLSVGKERKDVKSIETQIEDNADGSDNEGIEGLGEAEDGYALWRVPNAYSQNFMIDTAAIAFTSAKGTGENAINRSEIKKVKRYEREIDTRKEGWKVNTVVQFEQQAEAYVDKIKRHLDQIKKQQRS